MDMDVGCVLTATSTMNGDSTVSVNGTGTLQAPRALKTMPKAVPPEPRMEFPMTSHNGETYPQQRGPIAGVSLEASAQPLSLYEAIQQGLLSAKLGLALLEAQAVTGGLIDPIQGQLLPVAEAVRQGLVGLELKEKLLTAERALTGYPDPYGPGKLPLFQALHKEVVARDSGLSWLEAQLATGGIIDPAQGGRIPLESAYQRGLLDEETAHSLSDPMADGPRAFSDPNTQEPLTYQELRSRCVLSPATGLALLPLKVTFPALGGMVSSEQLLEAGILPREVFEDLREGRLLVSEVRAREEVQRYLEGTGSVVGVLLLSTGQRKSFYQALMEHLLPPGTALALLQAQAATCSLMDPASEKKLGLDEAVRAGLVGPEFREKLLVAERAVTGYPDPFSRGLIPLFQAMRKGLVQKELALRLLQAQLTTGGIVDPARKHRLPLEIAFQWNCLDKETFASLSQPTGFFDPNTQENLTYAQLLARCVTDPETGSLLLPLTGGDHRGHSEERWFIDHATQEGLRKATVVATSGKLKGQRVSLWKLLFLDIIPAEQRASLAHQYQEGTLSTEMLASQLSATMDQAAAASRITFEGLRDHVTPRELLKSEIINQDLYEKLEQGQTTAQDVGGLDSVKKYLQGTGCISGLLLPDSQEKISIYEARRKGYLRQGTSLILLEAQAATGFVIDPKENKRYSVEEALRANVIGPDVYEKLLSAERAVTGYTDPYTGDRLSLFQAMNKDLIVRDHGIRLLEAQIATGGIIDPVHSHRIPVEVAYKRGYFDRMMNLILSDPSDDTRGFFDPNTHENLTYLQLLEKCVTEPATGLCLLPLNSRKPQLVNEATRKAFQSSLLLVKYGRFKGQRVSVWDLINSEYFSEGQRREILTHYRLQKVTLEQVVQRLEEETKKWAGITLPTLRGHVTAYQLLESHIIDRDLLEKVLEGSVSPEELLKMESVRRYLHGSGTIGGVLLQPSNQRLSLYEAMKQKLLRPGVALPLLEAQAATGSIIDPVTSEKLSVDDAVRKGLVGPELHEKLHYAEEAVTGFMDPFTGKKVSLFQAMKKGLVPSQQAMQLLEAQVATGGIIDPTSHHHIPMDVAAQRGYIDEEMERTLSGASPATIQMFSTVDGSESLSYAQLMENCQQDMASGCHLLPLPQTAAPVSTDEQIQQVFRDTLVTEKGISLWDLLCSGHFTEEHRMVFMEDFQLGRMTAQEIVAAALRQVREAELQAQTHIMLPGLRGDVPAVWLLNTGIIDVETLEGLVQGTQSPREVAKRPEVKWYLQGTGCIAGVQVEGSKDKMSIYQAMKSNLLPPGLGLRLLEAQLASGSLVDPQNNQKLSVEEAVKTGVIGGELSEQLIQVERAVTGYSDPYTGSTISVWQAMDKGLIDQSQGFLLLQVQLATGGVVDPIHHLHLPLPAACRLGFLDEETGQVLTKTTGDKKFFFDPNTRDKVTYQELKDRCILDAETSLWLLPLSQSVALDVDDHTIITLKAMTVPVKVGRFKGQTVSLWDLLHSEYVSADKQKELVNLGRSGRAAALRQVVTDVTALIEETEKKARQITFPGLRKEVSANDLFRSQLIDKKTLDDLNQGKKTVHEVTEMEGVKQFLKGGNFIAGVLIQGTKERLSIYDAMRRHILRPGTALVLLEAQAATGFIIDPIENKKMSVEQALSAGLIGREVYEKLLSAEKAVTGYVEPYTNKQISLFEAMNKGLILKSHAIRLLEAQIATGGIIDPVQSHRVPVEVAYQRGYFDEEMNQILSDPSDDTKGFFDPNTHENLTYRQLLERCIQESESGLYMLQVVEKGESYIYIDEATKQLLRSRTTKVLIGKFANQTVSIWDLLSSQYFTQQKKRDLVSQFKLKNMNVEQLLEIIMKTIEETEKQNQAIKVKGLRGDVTAAELFNSGIINEKILAGLPKGKKAAEKLSQLEAVKRYTEGTGCIAGVLMPSTKEKVSIYEAMKTEVIPRPIGIQLLQAQAATGFIINPQQNQRLSVNEAVAAGLVGEEILEELQDAEKAVTGFHDPDTGERVSLYKAMKKGLVEKEEAMRMLEAQVATGGVIDLRHGHRLPVEVAYQRGYLEPETHSLLSNTKHGSKRFQDPNTHKKVNYAELHSRCVKDQKTGLALLPIVKHEKNYKCIEDITEKALKAEIVTVKNGKYKGRKMSVWDLLCSEYVTEEKKQELVNRYKKDTAQALENIVKIIWELIEEKEKKKKEVWFQGLRKQVTASELFKADIINKHTLEELERGQTKVTEIAVKERVKKYLEGTSCIAGVLVPSKADPAKQEKMSIYQAMWKGILRPGTALVLLEAQAATGFVIDPLRNQKLSVDEAVAAGVVGGEVQDKLLSAERAVTGYTDPYMGEQISLFQAMKRDLIVKDHGVRLLEAQIATGGVIDPVHSHRVPVEVAYQRGYFDEEMNQILSDPSDDTKGFFDPNTHENLTYMQLLRRCVRDPDTGLYMLQLAEKSSAVSQLSEQMRRALQATTVSVHGGLFRGQTVSVWELLFCRDVPETKRQALLRKYRAGTLSIEELTSTLTSLVMEAGDQRHTGTPSSGEPTSSREGLRPRSGLQAATMEVEVGHLRGRKVPVWDVLVSTYVSQVTREDLLTQYDSGALPLPALTRRLTTIIEEAEGVPQERGAPEDGGRRSAGGHSSGGSSGAWQEGQTGPGEAEADTENARRREEALGALRTTTMEVGVGQFKGQKVPVWDVLFSTYLTEARREELLAQHASGALTLQALIATLTTIIEETEEKLSKVSFRGLRRQVSASELRTSNILGLDTLRELAQGTKSLQEITEMDSVKRYLEGTSCIAGVLVPSKADPAKQEKMSIYQAMWKGILRPGTALVLLEAQAATGFVIDPLRNQKLSVDEAVAAGVVGGEVQDKLLSAERAVTGYTDPYTGEQISLFQAMKRDLIVKDHGVRLLEAQIATGGVIDPVHSHRVPVEVAYQRGYFDEEMNQILSDPSDDTKGFFDPNTHENLTYMQLLRRCVRDPDTGLYMLQLAEKSSAVSQLSEQMRRALQATTVSVHGGLFRGQTVSVWELLFCRDVPETKRQALLRKYRAGTLSIEELTSTLTSLVMEAGDQCHTGTPSSGEPTSSREGLRPRSGLQAATMEVEVGHLRGRKVPVWDVLVSTYVSQVTREDLLTQYDSGALPLPALTRRLTTIIEEAEGVPQERGAPEDGGRRSAGGHSSGGSSGAWQEGQTGPGEAEADTENARRREEALGALRTTTMEVGVGQFKGQKVPVWDVLFSTYLTEARREELLAQHASGALTLQALIATLTTIIEETEEKLSKVSFRGLRRQVSASELRTSNILGLDTLRELAQGTKSLQEITEMDSVKRYLEGTSCIAGVLVPSKADPAKQEKMSIYQAMWKGILRPGTALVLLEAQAATGFVIDPLHNQKLSVDEAVAAGVVGGEVQDKLLSAERAVTGYTDPYTGEQISLFQAMKRDLIVKDHGVRLLEAQIATGGVIDPVHSHRVPVEVAYQRGYFDEEMNQILSDPSDDTKGFFDPNTHENLTYMQLLRRCVRDPDTGLYMLQLAEKSSAVSQLSEQMRRALQATTVSVHGGLFRGQTVSVWELLFCRDVPETKRQALLRKYRAGTLSIEELTSTLTSLVMEAGDQRHTGTPSSGEPTSSREGLRPRSGLQAATMEVEVGHLRGRKVPVWDVLVSTYVSQVTREDLLTQYDSGALPLPALTRRLTTIIEEAEGVPQERGAPEDGGRRSAGGHSSGGSSGAWQEGQTGPGEAEADTENARRREEALGALRTTTMEVGVGQFKGQKVPVWDVLFSTYLTEARREELLAQHASGALTLQALIATLTTIIEETEEKLSKVSFRGLRRQVSASELRTSNILGLDTLRELAQGTKSLQEITEMDSVKRYLEGTSCIAGVLVPSKADPAKQEKMSIYQAMWKGILRPGTALVLLEAQAATGFVIDPLRNQKLSVDEAVAAGVVGGEVQDKLLSAERAVTGYTDPYTGEQISLFQAMKRDLIVKDHGVRLLEAQIATGGVIDPVHSHRVPVEVAYQRGYFDEEMNQILSDPSDDTKGFFDPNTHENLTYMQLLRRCVRDPDTGLYMLQLAEKSSAVSQLSEQMRRALQATTVSVHRGLFRGQTVSVWELLFCRDVPETKRQALLRKYQAGTLSIEELTSTLTSLVMEAGDQRHTGTPSSGEPTSSREGLRPRSGLQAATMEVEVGHLRGRKVPVWDVLVSTYVSQVTREDLLTQYDSGALPLPALTRRLTTIIEEAEGVPQERGAPEDGGRRSAGGHSSGGSSGAWQEGQTGPGEAEADTENARRREEALGALRTTTMEVGVGQFKGQKVPVWDVLFSTYLTEARREELLAQHASGALTLQALIATLTTIIEETEEKLSKVSFRGLRRQVSASELRTSNILGLDTLRELAQGTKSLQEITEMDSVKRYLEGTSCIAGVLVPSKADPAKQEKMSIYQAMWKGILRPGTALVLLEAQAATGFVIDPLRNQKLSVDEAVAAGVVGGEVQDKLLSAERAVTGYTDPYTGEQISLFQAMKRDLIVKDHGVRLLEAQIATGGVIDPVHSHRVPVEVAYQRGYFDEEMNQILSDPSDDTKGFFDPNTHENLTYMQLLRRCVRDPDTGLYMLQLAEKSSAVSQLSEQMRRALQATTVSVHGGLFRGQTVSVWELLFCRDVPETKRQALLRKYRAGTLSIEELTSTLTSLVMEAGDQRHTGTPSSGEPTSSREGLRPRSGLQAATMEVEVGHLRGRKVPVWDVLVSTYVSQVTREDLLTQYDSGALPLPALTRRLTTIIEEAEGVPQERGAPEDGGRRSAGGHSSGGSSGAWQEGQTGPGEAEADTENARRREEALGALRTTTMEVGVGQFKGQKVPVWDVLFSTYLTEARREELLAQHASGALTLQALIATLTTIIEETEEKLSKVSFRGLRRQVSASELRTSNILGLDTLRELAQGTKSLQEITEMDSVKRYLEGTSCIAGVLVPSKADPAKQEKMSIYQAMWKGILRPGTALVLLEAQAATGFVIDPLRNQKLSVDEAVAAGVVGGEVQDKLLSAERAVTGYTDPYTGEQISLFQAMKRDLIVKDHGVRLLEAQIATGGVIDPVHSHRVPVEVAYQRGYFDEEMNQILSDPSDDTKGFFDPNTHENLTYMQLLRRCVRDPDTGLYMLQLAEKSSAVSQLSEQMRRALQATTVSVHGGLFRGQTVSVWELLFCRDVPETKRQALLRKYRAGTLSIEELTSTLTSLVMEAGDQRHTGTPSSGEPTSSREGLRPRSGLQAATMEVEVGHLRGRKVPVWDVLVSTYVSQVTREDLLTQYDSGALPLPALTRRLTTIIEEAEGVPQERGAPEDGGRRSAGGHSSGGSSGAWQEGQTGPGEAEADTENARRREEALGALRTTTMEVGVGQFKGQKVPVWDVLFSTYLTEARREELLAQHASGALTLQALIATLTTIIEETEEKLSKVSFRGLRRQVSASELRTSNILGLDTLRELAQGTKSLQEITEMDSVKRYLEGTSCIAGVLVPSKADPAKQEKMSIYQAMWKGILRPGTALVLLEAQAATGFVIDPLRNQKLSVDEAVAAGVVGGEVQDKLLSAERAVTGYTDPYTGEQISLFQAMKRDLIVKDHGVRLLEAQIATGGVIDPVHSHRVPVEVAYQRGYFDEEMNQILSDPSDDTKGFFDPNTHENLTYMQLLRRCVRDPDTGLYMLQLAEKSSAVSQLSEQMRRALQATTVSVHRGLFRGQTVSVWELLFCRDVPETKRQALLRKYQAGTLSIEELTSTLTSLVMEAGDQRHTGTPSSGEPTSSREGLRPRSGLQAATMEVEVGHLRGRKVPVWDVLVSTYVSQVTREDLLTQYDSGALPLPALTRRLTTIIEEAEGVPQERGAPEDGGRRSAGGHSSGGSSGAWQEGQTGPGEAEADTENARRREEALGALRTTTMEVGVGQFKGQKVPVWDVLFSTYLTEARREELLAQHASGALTLQALIATLTTIIEETEEKLSKVSFRGLRRQVSASELRTSNILGLDTLRELAQGTKSLQEITEMDSVKRYLEGTSCIAGVLVPSKADPAKQEKMSIYQAMWKGILRPGTALVLLEAQAATGFVIDPLRNQKLSVDEAVAAGVVGGEVQDKLLSAERAVTGYTDPYTGEQISLFQAMKRDLIVKDHGVRLLEAQIATGGVIDPVHSHRVPVEVAYQRGYFDEEMNQILSDPSDDTKGFFDPNTHENLTYMQLLRRCVRDPDTGLYMLQLAEKSSAVSQLSEQMRRALQATTVSVHGGLFRGQTVSVWELLFCRDVPETKRQALLRKYRAGTLSIEELTSTLTSLVMEAGDQRHTGTPSSGEPTSSREGLRPRSGLQAATMEVEVGHLRGRKVPVWDVLVSTYVSQVTREDLLTQYDSGALPLPALTRRLTTIIEEAEGVPQERGAPEDGGRRSAGGHSSGGSSGAWQEGQTGPGEAEADTENARRREEALGALRTTTMEVGVGQFKGQKVPVWDVLFSTYLTEARREELLAQHASGALTLQALIATLTTIIEETEEKLSKVSFRGLRRQVSASELRTSNILGLDTLRELAQGTKSLQEITEMDSVKRYLEGTSCIAGVLVPSKADPAKQEKMSIYQAMWKGILRPGTALVLLEAQAATGFVIDPLRNQKLSVDEAVAAGVVGGEVQDKLLSAERAVTGYTDPYTGEQISLFQAMKRDLIVKDHGVRLLEAQIATGGVIDPVHSHRVPVEVAYQRGYFDEEMNQILSDPSDDTKGFFDPNTHENLTYMQLLRRCVRDPDTGLYMLQLAEKSSAVSQLSEQMRRALQATTVSVHGGLFRGQTVSVWELLFCRDVPETKRQALLRKYRAGTLSIEELTSTLTSLVMEAGDQRHTGTPSSGEPTSSREGLRPRSGLQAATMEVEVGHLRGRKVPVWDVLVSTYVSQVTREDLLTQYDSGALPLPALTRRLTTIIEEAEGVPQERGAPEDGGRRSAGGHSSGGSSGAWQEGQTGPGEAEADTENARRREEALGALRTTTMEVGVGQFKGQKVPVWDVLFSTYLTEARREELLAQHASGALTLQALIATLTTIIEETEEKLSKVSFRGLRRQVSASELRTSNILGLDTLRELAQGTKSLQEITEMDSVKRYLEGTSCIAGVLVPSKADPAKQEKMSIYQAMWKGILRPGTALVLLEAQAATGFVIDPLRNQKLSVDEAVAAGVVGGEVQDKLLSAERAVTGYTDPYTGEQISLFQAMKRDLIVKDHGVRLLEAQIATGGVIDPVHSHRVPVEVAYQRGYFDEEMNQILSDPSDDTKGFFDPNTHENLTYMQLLRRCVRDPDTGLYMLQLAEKSSAVSQLSEQMRRALQATTVSVHGGLFRGQTVSVWELLFCRDVPETKRQALLRKYRAGTLSIEELTSTLTSLVMEAGDQRHTGTPSSGEPTSSREGLRPRSGLQAATMEVEVGHLRGRKVPVWDVLVSTYVSQVTREDLLTQYDSGALPLPALTRRLTTIIEEAEGVPQERGAPEDGGRRSAGGHSSGGSSGAWQEGQTGPGEAEADTENARRREEALGALRTTTMEVGVGQFKGQKVPVWDVLFSTYLTEARREELLAQHASGALTLQALIATLTTIIEETEEKLSKVSFRGLRRQVSASELRTSNILGLDTLRELAQGTKSLQEITEMDSVKRYLEGTSCIAGVLVPSKADPAKQEKMSIYQAMWKGILRPGTALVLLEAQAATGFVIDPLRNQKLSVDEAVAAGVVGGEVQDKLLSAERAVTGYTDPYTGEQISLFQAMKRDLIVKDHGVRLLEAQIATGGVIDPVHSHRVPVEVAYQRGYFDEEMNQILSDPSDDTKGFFDPNTHENLTYMQLLQRCVLDPESGFFFLFLK